MTDAHRLPRNVVPRHYTLTLEPNIASHTFAGSVAVKVEVTEATATVTMNAIELAFTQASVSQGDDTQAAAVSFDETTERATLTFDNALAPGEAIVNIEFTGILNDKLRGFYRSTFTDTDSVEQTMATTQFESTNARRAFPCWDEPEMKATFGVTLVVDEDLMAISSGPEVSSEPTGDGRKTVLFADTVLMPTYLLAFVVGPMEATDPIDVNGTPLRIVHPVGKGHLTDFALKAGAFSLAYFEDYFGIPYPEAKLDLVAVPDFAFGAMENFGCATFREILLIVDTETATPAEMERSVDVIAHEIAHMWFGDLVTMKWWEGIWLKEAFATFCELLVTDAFEPSWDRWTSFGLSRTAAFDTDSLKSTRPIEFEVISPDDAEAMYDVLTYEKGAAVVRMLQQFLGEDEFKGGINHYLERHSYGNTETHDLWDALEEHTGQPARKIMDSWIYQGGYPLVTIEKVSDTTLRLSQQRFGFSADTPDATWGVPVMLTIAAGSSTTTKRVLLDQATTDIEVGGDPIDWVQGNAGSNGFYRVRYVGELHQAILGARRSLTPLERYSFMDDGWAALIAGQMSWNEYRTALEAFSDEDDLSVWQRMTGSMLSIDHHLEGDAQVGFREWACGILAPALARVGAEPAAGETDRQRQTRASIFGALGRLGHQDTVAAARSVHETTTDPTLKATAVNVIAATGTDTEYDSFVDLYRNAPTPQEERRYLYALAGFPSTDLTARLLDLISTEQVRTQDAPFVLATGLRNSTSGPVVWDYITTNWDTLGERFPNNSLPRMVSGVTSLAEADQAQQVRSFFDDHPLPQAGKTLDQTLERMDVNVDLRTRLRAEVR